MKCYAMKRLERIFDVNVNKWNMLLLKALEISWNIMESEMFSLYSNHLKHSKVYDVSYKIRNTFTLGSVFVNHDDD